MTFKLCLKGKQNINMNKKTEHESMLENHVISAGFRKLKICPCNKHGDKT